jgi:hypothetical protein
VLCATVLLVRARNIFCTFNCTVYAYTVLYVRFVWFLTDVTDERYGRVKRNFFWILENLHHLRPSTTLSPHFILCFIEQKSSKQCTHDDSRRMLLNSSSTKYKQVVPPLRASSSSSSSQRTRTNLSFFVSTR